MKSHLFLQQEMSEPLVLNPDFGRLAIFTKPSPAKTTGNEDSCAVFMIDPETAVLTVADGMGGLPQGEQASSTVITTLNESLQSAQAAEMCRDSILNGLELANKNILATGSGGGSTVAIAEITQNTVRPYHVGDSKVIVIGQRGKVKLQTLSHSPTEYAVEAGYIDQDEAIDHVDRHYITNLVGSEQMRIELGPTLKLNKYDTLILASDGLFDNLRIEEIVEIVRKGRLPVAMENLISLCNDRMLGHSQPTAPDDLTIILYRQNT